MSEWKPPAKLEELFFRSQGSLFNRNDANASVQSDQTLPVGEKPYQLYSVATPNGIKINLLLLELGLEFDAHVIDIRTGIQKSSGFLAINPNGKIPALVDQEDSSMPIALFESGAILMHLADKHGEFLPSTKEPQARAQVVSWLMWQMGEAPYWGNYGHFYSAKKASAEVREYGLLRFGLEFKRCLGVLEGRLAQSKSGYIADWGYSIADMAIFPWLHAGAKYYNAIEFIGYDEFPHVMQWYELMEKKPKFQEALKVVSFPAAK